MSENNQVANVTSTPFDGNDAAHRAEQLAAKAGKEVSEALIVIADAKQDMAGGPIRVMIALRNAFGEELDSFPMPGEKDGNNRDEITVEETVNGETKSRKTTFYTVFADSLAPGKAIVQEIEWCERAGKADTVKTDIPQHIIDLSQTGGLARRLDYLTGRRGTFRASIKKAMQLVFQFNAVNEVTGIQSEPIWEEGKEGEEIISAQKCIVVWQTPDNDANGKPKPVKYMKDYTVGSFLKLKPLVAEEKGGGFKNLDATSARAPQETDNSEKADRRIKTLDTAVGVAVELHRFIDEIMMDKDTSNHDKLIKGLKSEKATGEVVSSFVELRNYLDDIVKAANLQARYDKLQMGEFKNVA